MDDMVSPDVTTWRTIAGAAGAEREQPTIAMAPTAPAAAKKRRRDKAGDLLLTIHRLHFLAGVEGDDTGMSSEKHFSHIVPPIGD